MDRTPDPDAQAIMSILLGSPAADTGEGLLSAALAYEAVKQGREVACKLCPGGRELTEDDRMVHVRDWHGSWDETLAAGSGGEEGT